MREKENKRKTERDRKKERDRDREREKERDRERQRERKRERDRERERERERERGGGEWRREVKKLTRYLTPPTGQTCKIGCGQGRCLTAVSGLSATPTMDGVVTR